MYGGLQLIPRCFFEYMKINSRPLVLCIAGSVWPLLVIPFMILGPLDYHNISKGSLPAIIILIVASLGLLPFSYGLYTLLNGSRSHTVAILFSVTISAISYGLYSMIFVYYTLFSYGAF
jgi:hypothetical protein